MSFVREHPIGPSNTAVRGVRVVLAIAALGLAGCSGHEVAQTLGLGRRDAPNEFTVTTRAPLQMPPTFDLRPPAPGVGRPQEQSERQQAEEALVPETALTPAVAESSPGQAALLQQSGPPAPPDIRGQVNDETALDGPQRGFFDRLMFWRSTPTPGAVIDPAAEAQRLRNDAALGRSAETGATPIAQPNGKGVLDSLNPF